LWAPALFADEPRAAQLFREGSNAYERGDYMIAARAFEEAHREDARGATIYNAGLAWEAAGEKARAADAYQISLGASDMPPELASDARTRLTALEQGLGRLTITAPVGATVSVAHLEKAVPPLTVHLLPGSQELSVHFADGTTGKRRLEIGAAAAQSLAVEAPPQKPPPAVSVPTVQTAPPPAPPPAVEPVAPSTRRVWGFAALGGAVVFAGAASYLGLQALSARDEFDASGHRDADAHDRAATLRLWTNVAWAGAALSGGVGLWLVFSDSNAGSTRGSAQSGLAVGPASLSYRAQF
jgi:hypothetical protein